MVSKTSTLLTVAFLLAAAFAVPFLGPQGGEAEEGGSFEILGFDVDEILGSMASGMEGVGLVPNLAGACEECADGECDYMPCDSARPGSWNRALWDWKPTRAYFTIFFLLWMVFSVAIGFDDTVSVIFSFFLSSLMFNHLPGLFVATGQGELVAQGLFEYAFSALFMFVLTDYLLGYMWAMTQTTRLLLDAAITMMAVMFMNFTNLFRLMSFWVDTMLAGWGLVLFLLFMMGMKFFNTYSSMMNIGVARKLRTAGAGPTGQVRNRFDKEARNVDSLVRGRDR